MSNNRRPKIIIKGGSKIEVVNEEIPKVVSDISDIPTPTSDIPTSTPTSEISTDASKVDENKLLLTTSTQNSTPTSMTSYGSISDSPNTNPQQSSSFWQSLSGIVTYPFKK